MKFLVLTIAALLATPWSRADIPLSDDVVVTRNGNARDEAQGESSVFGKVKADGLDGEWLGSCEAVKSAKAAKPMRKIASKLPKKTKAVGQSIKYIVRLKHGQIRVRELNFSDPDCRHISYVEESQGSYQVSKSLSAKGQSFEIDYDLVPTSLIPETKSVAQKLKKDPSYRNAKVLPGVRIELIRPEALLSFMNQDSFSHNWQNASVSLTQKRRMVLADFRAPGKKTQKVPRAMAFTKASSEIRGIAAEEK